MAKQDINRYEIIEKITPLIENTAMRFGYVPIEIEFVKENSARKKYYGCRTYYNYFIPCIQIYHIINCSKLCSKLKIFQKKLHLSEK